MHPKQNAKVRSATRNRLNASGPSPKEAEFRAYITLNYCDPSCNIANSQPFTSAIVFQRGDRVDWATDSGVRNTYNAG